MTVRSSDDADAAWLRKGNRAYYGYKIHAATDNRDGFVLGEHVFYDRLQAILLKHGFDRFVETLCASFYAESRGRRSIPPGHYFRMRLVGYFEGIDSERGIEWRCTDALSLRKFLLLNLNEVVPDHSSLSRIRSRLSLETHDHQPGYSLTSPPTCSNKRDQLSEASVGKGVAIPPGLTK